MALCKDLSQLPNGIHLNERSSHLIQKPKPEDLEGRHFWLQVLG